jgi:site-specific DNA recombinase
MNSKPNGSGLPFDGYIRVSQVGGRAGDSFLSPVIQREEIERVAANYGVRLAEIVEEMDVSGSKKIRERQLGRLIEKVETGESGGVVVWNVKRFSRNLLDAVETVTRITAVDGRFLATDFDSSGPMAKALLGLLAGWAEEELDARREGWRVACYKAVERGIHVSPPQFGYLRGGGPINPKTKRPEPAPLRRDPKTAPYVKEIFERRAAGESIGTIRHWLNESGVPTVRGAKWQNSSVLKIIKCRTYLGIASGGRGGDFPDGVPNAHPPLIDEPTWLAAQVRPGMRQSGKHAPSLLRGLVRCGSCRYTMVARVPSQMKSGEGVAYQCSLKAKSDSCENATSITGWSMNGELGLEDLVVEEMFARIGRIELEGYAEGLDVSEDERELETLRAKRERDALDPELEQVLGRNGWKRHLERLTAQEEEVRERITEKLRRSGRSSGRPVVELREKWESGEMSLDERRTLVASLIQMVFVKPLGKDNGNYLRARGPLRRARIVERMHIIWADEPPFTDIPRQGKGGFIARPFPFPDPDGAGMVALEPELEHSSGSVG